MSKGHKRREFLTLAGSAAATASLAGCTGSEDQNNQDTGSTPADQDTNPNSADQDNASQENQLVGLLAKTLVTRDPHKILDADTIVLGVNTYDPFLATDEDGRVVEHVATDWTTENEGQTWVFEIREDLTSHAGNAITAEDIVYSANRYIEVGTGFSSLWDGILEAGNIEARDEYTVAFNLAEPYGPFLATVPLFLIVDSTEVKDNAEDGEYGEEYLNQNFAGTGPYEITSFTQGEEYNFQKFDDYWRGWSDDQFDTAKWRIVLEESTQRQLIKGGDADFSDIFLSPEAYEDMAGANNVTVHKEPAVQVYELPLNTQKEPMDDVKVREAFTYALDYATGVEIFDGVPAQGMVPNILVGHNDNIESYEQDLERARQALEDSSYSLDEINQMEIEFAWISSAPVERRIALLLNESLKEIGIESVNIESMTWANWTDRASSVESTPHISSLYHTGNYPSPEGFLYGKYHPSSAGSYNACNFYHGDQELLDVMEQARQEPDTETRLELWKEAQEIALNAYPGIFVANPPYFIGTNNNLGWEYRGGIQGFQRQFYHMTRKGDGRA